MRRFDPTVREGQEEDVHGGSLHDLFHRLHHQCQPEALKCQQRRQSRRVVRPMLRQQGPVMVRQRHRRTTSSCHQGQAGTALVSPEASVAGQVRLEEMVTEPEAAMVVVMSRQVFRLEVLDHGTPMSRTCRSGSSRTEGRRLWSCTARISVRINVSG